jgi:hypothetical protein
MKASTLEYPYQVIAYMDEPQLGLPVGPPWRAHVTVKRRFKLREGVTESQLIEVLRSSILHLPSMTLALGQEKKLGEENTAVEVLNALDWKSLNQALVSALGSIVQTRDPQFEGENATPHLTTNFRGEVVAKAADFMGRSFKVSSLWLVKEHPTGATSAVAVNRFEFGAIH